MKQIPKTKESFYEGFVFVQHLREKPPPLYIPGLDACKCLLDISATQANRFQTYNRFAHSAFVSENLSIAPNEIFISHFFCQKITALCIPK
jgi:hypothetical protein